jgi:hypothetical protein
MNNKIPLTTSEIGNLWATYMNCTMTICTLKFFLAKAEDEEIEGVLQYALDMAVNISGCIKDIYTQENHPIPVGFTNDDVKVDAPKLFSDIFFLLYVKNMARVGMSAYGLALALSTRADIIQLYSEAIKNTVDLNNKSLEALLSKGISIRPPSIFVPDHVDFVKKQEFLGITLSKKRPLTAIEIAHLFSNIHTNVLGRALLMGLGQVAASKDVKDYINRGAKIATEHIKIVSSYIEDENLPIPMHWDTGVLKSNISPFSDKLMLFHALLINNVGLSDFGASLGATLRADIFTLYSRLVTETTEYGEDGMNLMIENGWFEQPPSTTC